MDSKSKPVRASIAWELPPKKPRSLRVVGVRKRLSTRWLSCCDGVALSSEIALQGAWNVRE